LHRELGLREPLPRLPLRPARVVSRLLVLPLRRGAVLLEMGRRNEGPPELRPGQLGVTDRYDSYNHHTEEPQRSPSRRGHGSGRLHAARVRSESDRLSLCLPWAARIEPVDARPRELRARAVYGARL